MRAVLERDFLSEAARPRAFLARLAVAGFVGGSVLVPFLAAPAARWGQPDVLGAEVFRSGAAALLVLLALITPAATVGAILVERAQETLPLVLATPIGARSLALAKLLSRAGIVLSWFAAALPPLVLAVLFGGVSAGDVVGLAATALGMVLELGGWAILVSAFTRRLATGAILAFAIPLGRWILFDHLFGTVLPAPRDEASPVALALQWIALKTTPVPAVLALLDPLRAWDAGAALQPERLSFPSALLTFLAGPAGTYLLFSLGCAMVAVLAAGRRLAEDPAAAAGTGGGWRRALRRFDPRRTRRVGEGNPVAWKETRLVNTAGSRPLYYAVFGVMLLSEVVYLSWVLPGGDRSGLKSAGFWMIGGYATALALVACVNGAATMGHEKALGTLDLVRTSLLTPADIYAGKMSGIHLGLAFLAVVPAFHLLVMMAAGLLHPFTALVAAGLTVLVPKAYAGLGLRCGILHPTTGAAVVRAAGFFSLALVVPPVLHGVILAGLDAQTGTLAGDARGLLAGVLAAASPPVTVYATLLRLDPWSSGTGTGLSASDPWAWPSVAASLFWVPVLYYWCARQATALPRLLAEGWKWEGDPRGRRRRSWRGVRTWLDARRARARRRREEKAAAVSAATRGRE